MGRVYYRKEFELNHASKILRMKFCSFYFYHLEHQREDHIL